MAVRSEKLNFPGASGEPLAARFDLPPGKPRAVALFAHCFTCSKDIFAAARIAEALASEGIAVLRFDFTGLGHSGGEFANTNFSSNVADLVQAANYLRETHEAPKLLIGHSLGGAAILAAAAQVPEAVAVATIGAPSDPSHVAHMFHSSRAEIDAKGQAEVTLAGRPFTIKKQFLDDIEERKLLPAVSSLRKALMVFHAPRDQTVGIENAGQIFGAAKHPKSFVSLDGADHLLSRRTDAVYAAKMLSSWAGRYLDEEPQAKPLTAKAGEVAVRETGEGRFIQEIAAGSHTFLADEPKDVGGGDTGPGPYDLLLAGLGACTSMTLRMYADRKGWPLARAAVTLKHGRIHAKDCESCETETGRIDLIERQITLEGALSEEQRARLLEIADKCPVHRTLTGEIEIRTVLA